MVEGAVLVRVYTIHAIGLSFRNFEAADGGSINGQEEDGLELHVVWFRSGR